MEETRTAKHKRQPVSGKEIEGSQSDTTQIGFDFEKYAHFLEGADLTDDQKRELLAALWNVLSEFVMLGFGVHPIQQACGQLSEKPTKTAPTASDRVYLSHSFITKNFAAATDLIADADAGGVE